MKTIPTFARSNRLGAVMGLLFITPLAIVFVRIGVSPSTRD
jgi:hypothetical protein